MHETLTTATRTMTRVQYEAELRQQCAGPVSELYQQTVETFKQNPDWEGSHWAMWFEDGVGTVLGPINVAD